LRSSVNAAVLSLVIERPSYGGEIGRRFEERYDGLFDSRPQHMYKALDDLGADGLIEPWPVEDEHGIEREGYRATAKGARAYQAWLRSRIRPSKRVREEILIRFASTRPEDTETVEYLLDRYQQAVMALAAVPRVRTDNQVVRALDKERQTMVDGTLRWIAWARDELRSREP
jgi:DNA-binding PadR family transcriptional regulator